MARIIKVKPKKGLKVPRPLSNRFLPEHGAEVEMSPYWVRRINEGDIEIVKSIGAPKPVEQKPKTTKKDDNDNGGQK